MVTNVTNNHLSPWLTFLDVGCVDNVGLEGGGTLVGRTPHGGVVSKVIMLLLHTTTLAIPQAKSSYKTTLPPLTLFTLFVLFQLELKSRFFESQFKAI